MSKVKTLGKTLLVQIIMGIVALSFGAHKASADDAKDKAKRKTVVGCWKTIDDKTKKQKSVVKVWIDKAGHVNGRIIALTRKDDPKCDKCKGTRKGKRILGMKMMWGMKAHSWYWKNGKILDPANGKTYSCEIWTKKGNNNILQVRGFVFIFHRTQTWLRTSCPVKKAAKKAVVKKAAPKKASK